MWTQIRLLLQEQSDLGLHCLTKSHLNISDAFCYDLRFRVNWRLKTYVIFVSQWGGGGVL